MKMLNFSIAFASCLLTSAFCFSEEKSPRPFVPPENATLLGKCVLSSRKESLVVDIGDVETKQPVVGFIAVKNSTAGTLSFSGAKSSCGCLAGYPSTASVEAGSTFRVYVSLSGPDTGEFKKRVDLEGDGETLFSISLSGRAKPPFYISERRFVATGKEAGVRLIFSDGSVLSDGVDVSIVGDAFESAMIKEVPYTGEFRTIMVCLREKSPGMAPSESERHSVLRVMLSGSRLHEVPLVLDNPKAFVVRPQVAVLHRDAENNSAVFRCFIRCSSEYLKGISSGELVPELVANQSTFIKGVLNEPPKVTGGNSAICVYGFDLSNLDVSLGDYLVWRDGNLKEIGRLSLVFPQ